MLMNVNRTILPQKLLPHSCPVCGHSPAEHVLQAPDRFHGRTVQYRLDRCLRCGLVRLADPPRPDEMPAHYGAGYHHGIERAAETKVDERWNGHQKTLLSLRNSGTLLDIGCSSGAFLRTLNSDAWQLHGVEISPEEAARAEATTSASIFLGDPLDAPYEPETFDVITCFHLLEHVYQPLQLLQRIHSWLKPGGFLYVVVPNIDCWEARIFRSYWYGLELPRHLFHFSPSSLEGTAHLAELGTVRVTTLADSFSEHSVHYLLETAAATFGGSLPPLCQAAKTPFLVKVVRKLFRLSIELTFRYTARSAGRGASIEGIFCKRAS